MPTAKEANESMSGLLALTGGDARLSSFELRNMSNQVTVLVARELGAEVDEQNEARKYLQGHGDLLADVKGFRSTSEALASYREAGLRDDEEDRRLDRERIAARTALVSALEKATGRVFG